MLFLNEFRKILSRSKDKVVLYISHSNHSFKHLLQEIEKMGYKIKKNNEIEIYENDKRILRIMKINANTMSTSVRGIYAHYVFSECELEQKIMNEIIPCCHVSIKSFFVTSKTNGFFSKRYWKEITKSGVTEYKNIKE